MTKKELEIKEQMTHNEWLNSLKPGYPVIVNREPWGENYVDKVLRVTKTQIILSNGEKYNKSSGYALSQNSIWGRKCIIQPTVFSFYEINHKRAKEELKSLAYNIDDSITIEQIQTAIAALKKE